jgi:hypothetical protein
MSQWIQRAVCGIEIGTYSIDATYLFGNHGNKALIRVLMLAVIPI